MRFLPNRYIPRNIWNAVNSLGQVPWVRAIDVIGQLANGELNIDPPRSRRT